MKHNIIINKLIQHFTTADYDVLLFEFMDMNNTIQYVYYNVNKTIIITSSYNSVLYVRVYSEFSIINKIKYYYYGEDYTVISE